MKIFISTKYTLEKPIGSSVVTLRHAMMLKEMGHTVAVFCPAEVEDHTKINDIELHYYTFEKHHNFLFNRYNCKGQDNIKKKLEKFKPDLFYDVHGPTWAIEETSNLKIPIFSMVGDYNHLCLLNFLVTPELTRCNGPTDFNKCISCIKSLQPYKTRVTSSLLKIGNLASIITFILGHSRAKRWDYRSAAIEAFEINEKIRKKVDYYVIGDKQAGTTFSKFLNSKKIIYNQQFLPSDVQERAKKILKSNPNCPIIFGYVGRFDSYKGFSILLKAFLALNDYDKIQLWVVHIFEAIPKNLYALTTKKHKLKYLINNQKILCFQPQNDESLFDIMSRFSIGMIPSIAYETPNLVLMELISNKIPIIRSESDGMEHLIQNNINGLTYQYNDYLELAKKIKYVIDNPSVILKWKEKLPVLRTQNDYYKTLSPYFELYSIGK